MKSMKSNLMILAAILTLSVLFLTACSSTQPTNASTLAPTATTTESGPEQTTATVAETTLPAGQPMNDEDLRVEIEDATYDIFGQATDLLATMGEPVSFSEAPSCLFEGTDKTYEFDDIVVYTITSKGVDLIDGIDLLTSKYATRRGITVGSTKASIIAAYGEPFSSDYDLVYLADPSQNDSTATLTFIMDGDVVATVSLYSGSNTTAP
jgi:hypothetical protein